ncbi:MAG TPA: Flp family type IVb pilin [Acidimicrobiia bacterium]|nr:Flp family type IVb pilin [Acidimicrobiia bacterium]
MFEFITRQYLALTSYLQDREEGATAVEYGIMVALIAAVIVGVVTTVGTDVKSAFQKVVDAI